MLHVAVDRDRRTVEPSGGGPQHRAWLSATTYNQMGGSRRSYAARRSPRGGTTHHLRGSNSPEATTQILLCHSASHSKLLLGTQAEVDAYDR